VPAFEQLGKDLWRLQRGGKIKAVDDTDADTSPCRRGKWTPAMVAGLLESNIRACMHEVRKARLLVWLCESVLAWEERGKIALLIFERGRLAHSEKVRAEHAMPVPPGYRKYDERLVFFDAMVLDRMKVLAAGIRRLVSDGKWLRLCLRPGVVLDRKKLERMFYWI
jgi:hypothetical protein